MGDLATLVTAGSGVGAFVVVISYLLSANRQDRREYQEAIDRAERRADDAATRQKAAEQRAEALQQAVDEARAARRAAEDKSDELARRLERYSPAVPGGAP